MLERWCHSLSTVVQSAIAVELVWDGLSAAYIVGIRLNDPNDGQVDWLSRGSGEEESE